MKRLRELVWGGLVASGFHDIGYDVDVKSLYCLASEILFETAAGPFFLFSTRFSDGDRAGQEKDRVWSALRTARRIFL